METIMALSSELKTMKEKVMLQRTPIAVKNDMDRLYKKRKEVAAGISFVYEIESLPKSFAALIQGTVLYLDYMGIYLLNGCLPANQVLIFTLIFMFVFFAIWLCIYIPTSNIVDRMNNTLNH